MYFRIVMMYRIVFSTRFIWFFSVLIEMCRRTCGTRLSERAGELTTLRVPSESCASERSSLWELFGSVLNSFRIYAQYCNSWRKC